MKVNRKGVDLGEGEIRRITGIIGGMGTCSPDLMYVKNKKIKIKSSLVEFFGSIMYTIISSANSDSFISSLQICTPLISFWCLIVLANTLSTILNRYGESGHPLLVRDFSGIASSMSPFNLILAVVLQ